MKEDILYEKIRRELDDLPISTEPRVMYLLVEIRKVLDHEGDTETFELLRFYGDWCVHTILDRRVARKLVQIVQQKDTTSSRIITFGKLRTELRLFLGTYNLPTQIALDENLWSEFRSKLSNILLDVPVVYKVGDKVIGSFQFQNRSGTGIEFSIVKEGKESLGRILL